MQHMILDGRGCDCDISCCVSHCFPAALATWSVYISTYSYSTSCCILLIYDSYLRLVFLVLFVDKFLGDDSTGICVWIWQECCLMPLLTVFTMCWMLYHFLKDLVCVRCHRSICHQVVWSLVHLAMLVLSCSLFCSACHRRSFMACGLCEFIWVLFPFVFMLLNSHVKLYSAVYLSFCWSFLFHALILLAVSCFYSCWCSFLFWFKCFYRCLLRT